jgi:predicted RNA-binding protein with PUA-like domain
MTYHLLKTEPSDYNILQFESDGVCVWDGVENALALKHLRNIQKGDFCFIYHTGKEKQIVGLAESVSEPYHESDEKQWLIKLQFIKRFKKTLSLVEMKSEKKFDGFDLLRLPRLSVMPVPEPMVSLILNRVQ